MGDDRTDESLGFSSLGEGILYKIYYVNMDVCDLSYTESLAKAELRLNFPAEVIPCAQTREVSLYNFLATITFYFFCKLASQKVLQGPFQIKASLPFKHFLHELNNWLYLVEGCSRNCKIAIERHTCKSSFHKCTMIEQYKYRIIASVATNSKLHKGLNKTLSNGHFGKQSVLCWGDYSEF